MGNTIKTCYYCDNKTLLHKGHYTNLLTSYQYYCVHCDMDRLASDTVHKTVQYTFNIPCQYIIGRKKCDTIPTHSYGVYEGIFVCNKCSDNHFIVANRK